MGVHVGAMRGAVVVERVGSLGSHGGGDVGLLPPVPCISLHCHVLLGLAEIEWLLLEGVWSRALLPISPTSRNTSRRMIVARQPSIGGLKLVGSILVVHSVREKAVTLVQALTGLALQRGDDDGARVSITVVIQHCGLRIIVVGVGAAGSGLHSIGAVIAGVRVWGVMDCHAADNVLPLLGCRAGVVGLLVLVLLIRVAADGDDADCRAWGVWDDDGLPWGVVLVVLCIVVVSCGAGGMLLFSPPCSFSTGLGWAARSRGAVLQHSTSWRSVLLHPLGALRGHYGL